MILDIRIGNRTRSVSIEREGGSSATHGALRALIDGQQIEADAVETAPGAYSILLGGHAFEARVEPQGGILRVYAGGHEFDVQVLDPRVWRGRRSGALQLEGRQQITAPMPGKIVRLLVAQGAQVEAGQGLLVVEAMKMQNEIRSPKSGKVERLLVAEGQAVNSGEILVIVA